MANQINLTFKSNDVEQALYNWLKSKLNTGGYIKEILYHKYLEETQGLVQPTQQIHQLVDSQPPHPVKEEHKNQKKIKVKLQDEF